MVGRWKLSLTQKRNNIASCKTYLKWAGRPLDVTKSIVMNNANGGTGVLHGFMENLPLTCGQITTYANIFVGERAPFQLLLGRPWQRSNYVCIDERPEGTYLLFKDPHMHVRYEMLVTPDLVVEYTLEISEYLALTHGFMQKLESMAAQLPGAQLAPTVQAVCALGTIKEQAIMEIHAQWQQQARLQYELSHVHEGWTGTSARAQGPRLALSEPESAVLENSGTIADTMDPQPDTAESAAGSPGPSAWPIATEWFRHMCSEAMQKWRQGKNAQPVTVEQRRNLLIALDNMPELVYDAPLAPTTCIEETQDKDTAHVLGITLDSPPAGQLAGSCSADRLLRL